jgi:hypothetical protein
MPALRIYLAIIFVAISVYTAVVIANHGAGFLPVAFDDVAKMGWPGQFDLDFAFMLTLSALWVSWRHEFSGAGLALGLLALVGGVTFLSVYLFIVAGQSNGNVKELLLGKTRA